MSITPIPELEVPKDALGEKLANARKAVAAGVAAAFAAGVPIFGKAILDGSVSSDEAGLLASAVAGAFVSVAYVTWQTVNKPKPSDAVRDFNLASAVPPILVASVPADQVEYVGVPPLPTDPDDDGPRHSL